MPANNTPTPAQTPTIFIDLSQLGLYFKNLAVSIFGTWSPNQQTTA
jgi:hypothetical protein